MTSKHENLEERMARIKLKNKELEKKHRIAEEDRLDAMKIGALVKISAQATESDWPIEHKYEVEESDTEDQNPEEEEEKSMKKPVISRTGKEICPPADPVYNFLADETRDGRKKMPQTPNPKKEELGNKKYPKPIQQQHSNSSNNSNNNRIRDRNAHPEKKSANLQRSKSQNEGNNWRQHNNSNSNSNGNGNNNNNNNNREKRHSQQENQAQFNRQKSLNEKHFNNSNRNQFQQYQQQQNFHPQQQFDSSPRNQEFVERGGNISVSVSRDGEVKSVRLTSAPIIGSGRVAHSRQNMKPQFVVNMNEEGATNQQQNQGFPQRSNQQQDKKFNHRNKSQPKQAPLVPVLVPQPIADLIKKSSVQDRLLRNRVLDQNEQFAGALNQTAQ